MSSGYRVKVAQKDYRDMFKNELERREKGLEEYVQRVFGNHVSRKEELVINASAVTSDELENVLMENPSKAILILFRMTGASPRSVARDLRIRVGSAQKHIARETASKLAPYFMELLPTELSVSAILFHDKIQRENELVRIYKGRWENYVFSLLAEAGRQFTKRRIRIGNKSIEIDGVFPAKGNPKVAIDVKRIEAMEDYQKRSDEINAKARELKSLYKLLFIACIFFPFTEKKHMVLNRIDSKMVDRVYFQDEITRMVADLQSI